MAHLSNMRRFSAARLLSLMGMALLALGAPAYSASSALSLYTEGEYSAAISAGEAEGGANGYAMAARAAIADAELRDEPCLECLLNAERFAQAAIAADAENAEAHILFVTALGRRARMIGFLASQRESIATRTDDAIATALRLDPTSSIALAVRGAWHIEIVSQAGRFLARLLYGADVEEGKEFYRRAIESDPENLVIRYQYALSLDGYDFGLERMEIETALQAAIAGIARNAFEEAIRARARMLLDLLQSGMEEAFDARMKQFRGEP